MPGNPQSWEAEHRVLHGKTRTSISCRGWRVEHQLTQKHLSRKQLSRRVSAGLLSVWFPRLGPSAILSTPLSQYAQNLICFPTIYSLLKSDSYLFIYFLNYKKNRVISQLQIPQRLPISYRVKGKFVRQGCEYRIFVSAGLYSICPWLSYPESPFHSSLVTLLQPG